MKPQARYRLALAVVWLLILAYGVYFSAYSIQRHRAFLTHASDLGQIDQAIWNTLHGRLLQDTKPGGAQGTRLSDHVEPIFIPLSLVFLLDDNVEALLVVQSFALALGALPTFWIARKRFARVSGVSAAWPEIAGVGFAAMYLLFPALEAANLAEFHAVTLAPAPLLFAYHFGTEKAWGRFFLFSLLALAVKEEISLLVFVLGLWFWVEPLFAGEASFLAGLRSRLSSRASIVSTFRSLVSDRRAAFVVVLLSVAWFGLAYGVIVPHFNALGKSPYTCRYLAGEDCGTVVRGLFPAERLGYLGGLLASVGWIALLDPLGLFLGLPLLAANVLSNYPGQYSGTYHYSAPVAPYFVLAAIGGTARLIGLLKTKLRYSHTPTLVLLPAFALALGYHLLAGYTPAAARFQWPEVSAHNRLFDRLAAEIPPDAVLSTTSSLNPHLSHRPVVYRYPIVEDANYILLDVSESFNTNANDFRAGYDKIVGEQHFGVVDADDGYILLKRGGGSTALPGGFYDLFRAVDTRPQHPVTIDFGGRLRLVGYDVFNDAYGRGALRLYWQALQPLDRDYTLFPFYAGDDDHPRFDVSLPLTVSRWYPTSAWKPGETVIAQMVPLDLGPSARVGVAVLDGRWEEESKRLPVGRLEPANLNLLDNSTWVELGELAKAGSRYVMKDGQK